jgi:hypothetical protein
MTDSRFTMIENGRSHEIAASTDSKADDSILRLATDPLLEALGWTQESEGICQGDVCIPIANRPDLITEQGVDLLAFGEVLGRPVAIDRAESVASFGAETSAHGRALATGVAPDFTLPDLSGKEYSLSSFKGKKVLLIAYASW